MKEESLTSEDIHILDVNKPDANNPAEKVDEPSNYGRIPKKNNEKATQLQKWTNAKKILQNKVNNACKAQKGGVEEVYTLCKHLLGK